MASQTIEPSLDSATHPDLVGLPGQALNCYLASLISIADCLSVTCPPIGAVHRDRLLRWPQRLGFELTTKSLKESELAVRSELRDFSELAGEYFREVPSRAQLINSLVLRASEILRDRTESYHELIDSVVERLEDGAGLDDPEQFRRSFRQQVTGLRASSDNMMREVRALLAKITEEAALFQNRLENPEYLASTDEATGFPNRLGSQRQLRNFLESGQQFCSLLFRLNNFENIPSDQIGPLTQRIAQHLSDLVRPTDVVCRWSQDRFLVIFTCSCQEAESRARQIASGLADSYVLEYNGHKQRHRVEVNCSVVETNPNADLHEMVERIDCI